MNFKEFEGQLHSVEIREQRITDQFEAAAKTLTATLKDLIAVRDDHFAQLEKICTLEKSRDFTFSWGGVKYTIRRPDDDTFIVILHPTETSSNKGAQAVTNKSTTYPEWTTFESMEQLEKAHSKLQELREFNSLASEVSRLYVDRRIEYVRRKENLVNGILGHERDPYW